MKMEIEPIKEDLKEPVGVLGVGVEGRATIDYLLNAGIQDITALDRNPKEGLPSQVVTCFGSNHDQGLDRFATIFRSPGIRPDHPSLVQALKSGTCITSAVSHFLKRCPAPVVGVTGTVGKGTCATLAATMLKEHGFKTHLGGNIGSNPFEFLNQLTSDQRVVLELSSFQAMDIAVSPNVVVILKTTSEHLDWHLDLVEYRSAKANLLAHQRKGDVVIYNADSVGSTEIAGRGTQKSLAFSLINEVEQGLFLRGNQFVLRQGGNERPLPIDLNCLKLKGSFNLENVAAAILAALSLGGGEEVACRAGVEFKGLPHRLELVTTARGIAFYNDSYATRPEAALGALSCFEDTPLALILGGSEKYADFDPLAQAVVNHPTIKHVSLIGATANRLGKAIEQAGPNSFAMKQYDTLEPAVDGAVDGLKGAGVVLLAPACASFGLFPNYKVRGERFRTKAIELAKGLV